MNTRFIITSVFLVTTLSFKCELVKGQSPVDISTDSLPDAVPAQIPESVKKVRKETLILQIPNLNDLSSLYLEDLSSEEIQNEIVEKNPTLLRLLPKGIILLPDPMEKMAKKYYRFDFFLPIYLRSQESVKNAFKKYSKNYARDFQKLLAEGTKFLHEGVGKTLLHPDFFYDSTFTFVYLHTCSNVASRNNMQPGYEQMMASRGMNVPHPQKAGPDIKSSFEYIKTLGIFTRQQMELFISKHPSGALPFECYPADFLIDEEFVTAMNNRFPHANFIEAAYNSTKKESLKGLYIERLIKKISDDYRFPANLTEVKIEDWKDLKLQAWAFENPNVIKLLDPAIKFERNLLEAFVKNQFKPARYFSEIQKTDSELLELLKKNPNDDESFHKVGKEMSLKLLEKTRCCGPSYTRELANFVKELPVEFIADDEFMIETIKKARIASELLKEYLNRKMLGPKTKDYLVSNCKSMHGISSLLRGRESTSLNSDPEFKAKLEKACL